MSYHVRELTSDDDGTYEFFLKELSRSSPKVLGYHYPFYRDIIESNGIGDPYYLGLYNDHEQLEAVLPGFTKTARSGTVYSSMPFFGPNAGVLCKGEIAEIAHQTLLNHLQQGMLKKIDPLTISVYTPFLSDQFDLYENELEGCYVVDKMTQYLRLENLEWDNKIRYDIRKAEKAGMRITESKTSANVSRLIQIYNENCATYGIPPKPERFINELANASSKGEPVDFYFAEHEDQIIGGLIVIYSDVTLSYYLPCALDSERSLQPVTFLINYAVQKAKSKGIKFWNWEASPGADSGVFRFKKKWGSEESSYKIYIKLLKGLGKIKQMGAETISSEFPYFFVFPFNQLDR